MDFPFLLIILLTLPIAVAGVIVCVSVGRRRGRTRSESPTEPAHRLQAGTAAVQDAAVHRPPAAPVAAPARDRRAASSVRHDED